MQDEGIFSVNTRNLYQHPTYTSHLCGHCGKEYSAARYLNAHQRSGCSSTKRHLSDLLEQTRAHWESRKKHRIEKETPEPDLNGQTSFGLGLGSVSNPSPHCLSPDPAAWMTSAGPSVDGQSAQVSEDLDVPVAQRKGTRERRLPVRFRQDILPQAPPAVDKEHLALQASTAANAIAAATATFMTSSSSPVSLTLRVSKANRFGVRKSYLLPSGSNITHDPDNLLTLQHLTNTVGAKSFAGAAGETLGPFPNKSSFLMADWYWQSTSKSFLDFQKLVAIFRDKSFSLGDVIDVNWQATFRILGANREDVREEDGAWIPDDGWKTTPVSINVPFHQRTKDPGIHSFLVGNFRHRSITSVIKETLSSTVASTFFHYHPYKATWRATNNSPELELYGELYTSRAFCDADEALQREPPTTNNRGMERVIVALMFWLDGTQLTSFGGASLWPCYLFFGNESKYRRSQPSERLGHQIAYFLKLPDKFDDYLTERNEGKMPSDALLAYCSRELFHQQWNILLDGELREAMKSVLISGIRNNGLRPCHRCLIAKVDIWKIGAPTDTERVSQQRRQSEQEVVIRRARASIASGYAVDSDKHVEPLLMSQSLTPTENAFSVPRIGPSLDIIAALVVDILHEFEIGVWKRLYIHCLRPLKAFTNRGTEDLTAKLDSRYRSIPSFGKDTVRKFPLNVSEMKRKAARDFEDLLQCAIPAFEGLLPEPHNTSLMTLLYVCAQWHALAKLRLHHDRTLDFLDYTTIQLGAHMRRFERDTCSKVETRELAKEAEARARRNGKGSSTPAPATLGIFTIKFHYLGDYTSVIRRFGTTDSYSTQIGELYHRTPKSWYSRTDKKDYTTQLSQIERRQARLSWMRGVRENDACPSEGEPIFSATPPPQPDAPYTIGSNQNRPYSLTSFIATSQSTDWDESQFYKVDFIPKLKRHLLPRLLQMLGHEERITPYLDQWPHIVLEGSRLYAHQLLHINFTTYDVRRDEDIVHINTPQCNVMLLNDGYTKESDEVEHQYLYGKVIGIFHANVSYVGLLPEGATNTRLNPQSHRIDFAWIHWYQFQGSATEFQLDRVSLTPISSTNALGFVDPANIVRAVHLIPQFSGKVLDPPMPRPPLGAINETMYEAYFINRFADRDMFMRFQHGMSIGHTYMHSEESPAHPSIPSIPPGFDYCLDVPRQTADAGANEWNEQVVAGSHLEDVEDSELSAFQSILDDV